MAYSTYSHSIIQTSSIIWKKFNKTFSRKNTFYNNNSTPQFNTNHVLHILQKCPCQHVHRPGDAPGTQKCAPSPTWNPRKNTNNDHLPFTKHPSTKTRKISPELYFRLRRRERVNSRETQMLVLLRKYEKVTLSRLFAPFVAKIPWDGTIKGGKGRLSIFARGHNGHIMGARRRTNPCEIAFREIFEMEIMFVASVFMFWSKEVLSDRTYYRFGSFVNVLQVLEYSEFFEFCSFCCIGWNSFPFELNKFLYFGLYALNSTFYTFNWMFYT